MTDKQHVESYGTRNPPPWWLRWSGWLVIAVLSTFFAQITCASEPFAFFQSAKWSLMVIFYGLHILILSSMFFNQRNQSFASLYILGVFFGMYEAYATKVLWNPDHQPLLKIAGISVIELGLLAFFWHAFMAFICPLMVTEVQVSTSSNVWNVMPKFLRREKLHISLALLFGIMCGLLHGASMRFSGEYTIADTITSSLGSCTAVYVVLVLWWLIKRRHRIETLTLLPDVIERRLMLIILGLVYAFFYFTFRPKAVPGMIGHISIIVLYMFLFCLRRKAIQKGIYPKGAPPDEYPHKYVLWPLFSVAFILASLCIFVSPGATVIMIIYYYGFSAVGYLIFLCVCYAILVSPLIRWLRGKAS
jgi:hypothetical protein